MRIAQDWRWTIVAAYTLLCGGIMAVMGRPDALSWYAIAAVFLVVAVAPVALLALWPRHASAMGAGALLLAAFGTWAYVDTAFVAEPDAQGGLVFVAVPLFQFVAALVWLGLVHLFARLRERETK